MFWQIIFTLGSTVFVGSTVFGNSQSDIKNVNNTIEKVTTSELGNVLFACFVVMISLMITMLIPRNAIENIRGYELEFDDDLSETENEDNSSQYESTSEVSEKNEIQSDSDGESKDSQVSSENELEKGEILKTRGAVLKSPRESVAKLNQNEDEKSIQTALPSEVPDNIPKQVEVKNQNLSQDESISNTNENQEVLKLAIPTTPVINSETETTQEEHKEMAGESEEKQTITFIEQNNETYTGVIQLFNMWADAHMSALNNEGNSNHVTGVNQSMQWHLLTLISEKEIKSTWKFIIMLVETGFQVKIICRNTPYDKKAPIEQYAITIFLENNSIFCKRNQLEQRTFHKNEVNRGDSINDLFSEFRLKQDSRIKSCNNYSQHFLPFTKENWQSVISFQILNLWLTDMADHEQYYPGYLTLTRTSTKTDLLRGYFETILKICDYIQKTSCDELRHQFRTGVAKILVETLGQQRLKEFNKTALPRLLNNAIARIGSIASELILFIKRELAECGLLDDFENKFSPQQKSMNKGESRYYFRAVEQFQAYHEFLITKTNPLPLKTAIDTFLDRESLSLLNFQDRANWQEIWQVKRKLTYIAKFRKLYQEDHKRFEAAANEDKILNELLSKENLENLKDEEIIKIAERMSQIQKNLELESPFLVIIPKINLSKNLRVSYDYRYLNFVRPTTLKHAKLLTVKTCNLEVMKSAFQKKEEQIDSYSELRKPFEQEISSTHYHTAKTILDQMSMWNKIQTTSIYVYATRHSHISNDTIESEEPLMDRDYLRQFLSNSPRKWRNVSGEQLEKKDLAQHIAPNCTLTSITFTERTNAKTGFT